MSKRAILMQISLTATHLAQMLPKACCDDLVRASKPVISGVTIATKSNMATDQVGPQL